VQSTKGKTSLESTEKKINFTKGWFQHTDGKKRGKRTVIIINLKETKVREEKGGIKLKFQQSSHIREFKI
jgi:hypothetical protein